MTIEIHPDAKVSAFADIEDSTRGSRIVLGKGSEIDSFVKVKPAGGSGDLIVLLITSMQARISSLGGSDLDPARVE